MLSRGRLAKPLEIKAIRDLVPDDLLRLRDKRSVLATQRLRDPHHALARLIAAGVRPKDAAAQTGFTISRVYVLHSDPAFKDLVAKYRDDVDQAYVSAEEERYRAATSVNLKALRTIEEHFDIAEETGELVSLDRALRVFSDTSDRTGLVKKSIQTNVNIDFAKNLERAKAARDEARKVIDVTPTENRIARRI
jgi:hypothetical protein